MTATRLLVLGVVRVLGRAHGYQVRRELVTWGAEEWANVKPGSIYHALRQLAKNGMLRTVGVEDSDEGPERTLYELADDGDVEFDRLLCRALSRADAKPEFFGAGLTFMTALPRATVVALLRHRVASLEGTGQELSSLLEDGSAVPGVKPAHVWELFHWWEVETQAARDFTRSVIERLEGGAYQMADDEGRSFGTSPEPTAAG